MELTAQQLGYPIRVAAHRLGDDLSVSVTGGVSPHIGSVTVAFWNDGALSVEETALPGHKDHLVSTPWARRLAEHLKTTVVVSCGIHYDGPSPEQLSAIVACTQELLEQLLHSLCPPEL